MNKNTTTKLRQKVLITGGSSGIGFELARKFLEKGFTVIIADRKAEKLKIAQEELKNVLVFQCDVTKDNDVKKLRDYTQKQLGGIDILVNNAGVMNMLDIGDEKYALDKKFEEIEINYLAPIRVLHYFLPQLKKSKKPILINVSSALAYVPLARAPIYSSTKSALHHWTAAIRPQLRLYGIRVVELLPPIVNTKLAVSAGLTSGKLRPMQTKKCVEIFWKKYNDGHDEIAPGISKYFRIIYRLSPTLIYRILSAQPLPSKIEDV